MLGFRHTQMIPLGDFDGRQLSVLDAAIDGRSVARFLFILPHFGVRFRRSLPFISTYLDPFGVVLGYSGLYAFL